MNTVVLDKPERFLLIQTREPEQIGPEDALMRVHRVGICGTDLHAYRGRQPFFTYPRILGHELGVEIVGLGEAVRHLEPGMRCAVEPYRNTSIDQAVRRGKTNCGENVSVLGVHEDGGMREYLVFPARYLHPSDSLEYEQLALVETLGIGCHAVNRADVQPEDLVLVIGAGPIGLTAVQFSVLAGATVLVTDINEDRLEFVSEMFSDVITIRAGRRDPVAQLRRCLNGDLPTIVMDATGHAPSMMRTFEYAAPGGKIVFIGLVQGDITFHDPYFHKKELTLLSSRNALSSDFKRIIHLMETGRIKTRPWITHESTLKDMIGVFKSWLNPESKVIKAMVHVSQ